MFEIAGLSFNKKNKSKTSLEIPNLWITSIASLIAGVYTKFMMHPIDIIKSKLSVYIYILFMYIYIYKGKSIS